MQQNTTSHIFSTIAQNELARNLHLSEPVDLRVLEGRVREKMGLGGDGGGVGEGQVEGRGRNGRGGNGRGGNGNKNRKGSGYGDSESQGGGSMKKNMQVISADRPYSQLIQQISLQLQKRIINVKKIKQLGQALYNKLNQDITMLCYNQKKLSQLQLQLPLPTPTTHPPTTHPTLTKLQQMCFKALKKLATDYQTYLERTLQAVEGGGGDARHSGLVGTEEGEFLGFLGGGYGEYVDVMEREIMPIFNMMLQSINFYIPGTVNLPTTPPYPTLTLQQYQTQHSTLLQILQKLRNMLQIEYQQLISSTSSTSSTGSPSTTPTYGYGQTYHHEQQSQHALIFLSKIKRLFADMQGILCEGDCSLNRIYWVVWGKRRVVLEGVEGLYGKYVVGKGGNRCDKTGNVFKCVYNRVMSKYSTHTNTQQPTISVQNSNIDLDMQDSLSSSSFSSSSLSYGPVSRGMQKNTKNTKNTKDQRKQIKNQQIIERWDHYIYRYEFNDFNSIYWRCQVQVGRYLYMWEVFGKEIEGIRQELLSIKNNIIQVITTYIEKHLPSLTPHPPPPRSQPSRPPPPLQPTLTQLQTFQTRLKSHQQSLNHQSPQIAYFQQVENLTTEHMLTTVWLEGLCEWVREVGGVWAGVVVVGGRVGELWRAGGSGRGGRGQHVDTDIQLYNMIRLLQRFISQIQPPNLHNLISIPYSIQSWPNEFENRIYTQIYQCLTHGIGAVIECVQGMRKRGVQGMGTERGMLRERVLDQERSEESSYILVQTSENNSSISPNSKPNQSNPYSSLLQKLNLLNSNTIPTPNLTPTSTITSTITNPNPTNLKPTPKPNTTPPPITLDLAISSKTISRLYVDGVQDFGHRNKKRDKKEKEKSWMEPIDTQTQQSEVYIDEDFDRIGNQNVISGADMRVSNSLKASHNSQISNPSNPPDPNTPDPNPNQLPQSQLQQISAFINQTTEYLQTELKNTLISGVEFAIYQLEYPSSANGLGEGRRELQQGRSRGLGAGMGMGRESLGPGMGDGYRKGSVNSISSNVNGAVGSSNRMTVNSNNSITEFKVAKIKLFLQKYIKSAVYYKKIIQTAVKIEQKEKQEQSKSLSQSQSPKQAQKPIPTHQLHRLKQKLSIQPEPIPHPNPSPSLSLSPTHLQSRLQTTILNLQLCHKILTTSPSPSPNPTPNPNPTTHSILTLTQQCLNFEYQSWRSSITRYEHEITQFETKCRNLAIGYTNANRSGRLYTVVYKLVKEYVAVMEVICDVFWEFFYVYGGLRGLEGQRGGSLEGKYVDLFDQDEINYLSTVLSFKIKMKEQVSQIDKFNNIPRLGKAYLKNIYNKFRADYQNYLPYSEECLSDACKSVQTCIGFKQNHQQIFQILQDKALCLVQLSAKTRSQTFSTARELVQVVQISTQINQLQKQLKQIIKASESDIGKKSIPFKTQCIEQLTRLVSFYRDQFKLVEFVSAMGVNRRGEGSSGRLLSLDGDVEASQRRGPGWNERTRRVDGRSLGRGGGRVGAEVKFMDQGKQVLYNKVIEIFK